MSARRHALRLGLGAAVMAGAAARAEAHLVSTGLGSFYDGIGHFALSPDDIVPAVGLALLAGLRGPPGRRWALWILPAAWIAGGLAGVLRGGPAASGQVGAAATFLVIGGLVAADLRFGPPVMAALALLVGGWHGYFNGLALAPSGVPSAAAQLCGIAVALFLIVLYGSEGVLAMKRPWMRVVVRVAGSWIAASGLLLLGWSLRSHGALAAR